MRIEEGIQIPKTVAFLLGFLLTFNVYLMPWSLQSPRATDLAGVLLLTTMAVLLLMGLNLSLSLLTKVLIVGILLFPMVWNSLLSGGSLVNDIRWVSGIGWALGLTWMAKDEFLRPVIFKALILGTLGGLVVVILQSIGMLQLTMNIGLAPRDATESEFWGFFRPPGIEKHVNGSAAVLSLALPVALGLIDENRAGLKWLFIALGVVLVGGALTLNRSSILVASITLIVWTFFAANELVSMTWKLLLVVLVATVFATYGPPGGWQRWMVLENPSQSDNLQARIDTTLAALNLSIENPLGIGEVYKEHLERRSGYSATHNAYLQLALLAGIPAVVWLVWKLFIRSVSLFRKGSIEAWLSIHLAGLFFAEEYFGNPTLIIISLWLMISPITKYDT